MNTSDVIPIVTSGGESRMVCPVCGLESVHPIALECISPGTRKGRVFINHDGLAVDPQFEAVGRGAKITLQFCCESGHQFAFSLHFHKGTTFVERQSGPPLNLDEMKTIWRD